MSDTSKLLSTVITAVDLLIEGLANTIGEPVADVRKRVLADLAKPAADPTDLEAALIEGTFPDVEEFAPDRLETVPSRQKPQ